MENNLYNKIIYGNIEVHKIEAQFYDNIHPELFNWVEQFRINKCINFVRKLKCSNTLRALDIGCGTGNITIKLAKLGYVVTAIDISSDMLDILKNKLNCMNLKNVELINSNIDDFIANYHKNDFNIITISSVLHHLPNYLSTLSKILQLIERGGFIFIIHEPTMDFSKDKHRALRNLLRKVDNKLYSLINRRKIPRNVPKRDWSYSDYHIYHDFREKEVYGLIMNNFQIKKFYYYSTIFCLGISNIIDTYILQNKSNFLILAQKKIK